MVWQLEMNTILKPWWFVKGALISLLGLALLGCTGIPESAQWRIFGSPRIGHFSIDYPSSWRSERFSSGYRNDPDLVALFFPPAPQLFPVVRIARKSVPSPKLDDAVNWGLERFEAMNPDASDEFEILPLEEITIKGAGAMSREFIMDTETPLPLKRRDIYIARERDILVITFISTLNGYEDALPLFDHMINSFESLEE